MNRKQLRARIAQLTRQAEAKLAAITDGMPNAQARAIEAEHQRLLAEIDKAKKQLRRLDAAARRGAASRGVNVDIDVTVDEDVAGEEIVEDIGSEEIVEAAPGEATDAETDEAAAAETGEAAGEETGEDEDEDEEERAARARRRRAAAGRQAPGGRQPAAAETIRRQAAAAERGRIAEIGDLVRRHGMDEAFRDLHVRRGSPIQTVKNAILDAQAERSERDRSFSQVETGGGLRDEADGRRGAMVAALAARMARAGGERNVQVPEHARQYAEMGLPEMAAECIGYRGPLRTARQCHDVLVRAFGSHTTGDFPGIFVDALNVRLLARYEVAAPTYRRFFARQTAADLRDQNVVRAGDFPALQPVGQSGEIKSGTFSESLEKIRVTPHGVKFTLSRHMLINDQLGAIEQILGSAGDRVADFENALAFALLVSGAGAGPTLLTDGKAMFHADHNNLAGSGAAITVASVGAGRAAMMKQQTLDGIKANFTPVLLLTGPDKLTEAEQLLTSITPATQAAAVPESIRRLVPVGDANIAGNAWFLFADPAAAPNFAYAYLDGFEGPRFATEEPFDTQGLAVKLEHDFGVAGIDYRGGFRNPGA